ncbi:metallophosphoesterase family protein [Niallia sp. NCCP-28]|uniref:metallophosphoesterase family protein n=1 Tax=Niallia sp. NCCP-28 TaxID=2934712 RepID=UPI00208657C7|nr:metallophosphoesterase [Niallia sp. NCCP-28]GKU81489.1 putative metallophosphoesterase YsnB [Niallia sp. NCCP-28]
MKVLIVSDSHGLANELKELKKRHKGEVDLFLHCGDSELAANEAAIEGYKSVRGNCDYEEKYPNELIEEALDAKIFLTHGHLYGVKSSVNNLLYRAKEVGANIVCFGHSHYLGMELIDGILFINPGSLRLPRGRIEKTYVILTIGQQKYKTEVYDYAQGKLPNLTTEFPRE